MEIRVYSCDQCTKNHKKCNKVLPRCLECVKRNRECTLNRKIINVKKRNNDNQNMNKFKLTPSNQVDFDFNPNEKMSHKLQLKLEPYYLPSPSKVLTPKFKSNSLIFKYYISFKDKVRFENLMTLVQCPSPFSHIKSNSLLVTIIRKLSGGTIQQNNIENELHKERYQLNEIRVIFKQAIENYFRYNNEYFPLFIKAGFNFKPLSFYLKLTIISCGLLWMKRTPLVNKLISCYEGKLFKYLSKISNIKASLENVQILLLTLTGLTNFKWVGPYVHFFIFHCYRISSILSLDQSPSYFNTKLKYNRAHTYCLLNAYYSMSLVIFGSYFTFPNKPKQLNRKLEQFENKIKLDPFKFYNQIEQVKTYHIVNITSFYIELSEFNCYLRIYKETNIRQDIDQSQIDRIALKLITRLIKIREKYIKHFKHVLKYVVNSELIELIEQACNCVYFFFHSTANLVYLFQCYSPEYRDWNTNSKVKLKSNQVTVIHQLLSHCYLMIQHANYLCHKFSLTLDCPNITLSMMLILRFGYLNPLNQEKLKEGIKFINFMATLPCKQQSARINLRLIEIVAGFYRKEIS